MIVRRPPRDRDPSSMMFGASVNDQFRPEFIEATQAALWNFWFWIAYAIPFIIVIPASALRWGGCIVAPLAFVACWLAYAQAISVYDNSFAQNAVTELEWDAVTADTGRTFAPILRGTPIAITLTLVACGIGGLLGPRLRKSFNRSWHSVESGSNDGKSLPTLRSDDPHEPPGSVPR